MLAVVLVVVGIVIYIVFKGLANSSSDSSFSQGFESGKRIVGAAGSGQSVNPETGRIRKQGLLGWVDTDERFDPETGKMQKEGMISWCDTVMICCKVQIRQCSAICIQLVSGGVLQYEMEAKPTTVTFGQ